MARLDVSEAETVQSAPSDGWADTWMPTIASAVDAEAVALYVYPIKSCAGVRVPALQFDEEGRILGDREWIVTDAGGELAWLGSHPRLALLQPRLLPDALLLRAAGLQPVNLRRDAEGVPASALIWNPSLRRMDRHAARDAGPLAAQFLRELTGEDLRLVRLERSALTTSAPHPLHAISVASVADFNAHLASQGLAAIDERRLRPNLVLRGMDAILTPFLEEHARQMVWADKTGAWRRLLHRTPTERCRVTNVDPDTGEVRVGIDTALAALSAQRWPGQPSRFGVYLQPPARGWLGEGTVLTMELDF